MTYVEDAVVPLKKYPLCCSHRITLALIGFFMFFHLYAQRIGMSVAIVCMVNQTAIEKRSEYVLLNRNETSSTTSNQTQCSGNANDIYRTVLVHSLSNLNYEKDGPFVWEKSLQGHILGSFFYGYLVSQTPGGLLEEQVGGKWVMVGSMSLSTVATLLTIEARVHVGLLILVRVFCGVGSGTLYPAMHAMWGQWAPPLERATLCGVTYAGALMGNVITMPVSGLLCQHGFSDGWDSIFYVAGLVAPAVMLIGLSFVNCTQTVAAVVLLVLAVSLSGFDYSGFMVNHMDIAPQFAGTLMGLANGISATTGFIAPYAAAVITRDQTRKSWQIAFILAAAIYVIGAVLFWLLSSAEIQPWAKDEKAMDVNVSLVDVKYDTYKSKLLTDDEKI